MWSTNLLDARCAGQRPSTAKPDTPAKTATRTSMIAKGLAAHLTAHATTASRLIHANAKQGIPEMTARLTLTTVKHTNAQTTEFALTASGRLHANAACSTLDHGAKYLLQSAVKARVAVQGREPVQTPRETVAPSRASVRAIIQAPLAEHLVQILTVARRSHVGAAADARKDPPCSMPGL